MPEILVVAEIGTNFTPHDLDSALEMVRVAARAGADLAKFQDWHPLEQMDRPPEWKERCAPWTLPPDWHEPLRAEADGCGIGFMCSVFTPQALARALRPSATVHKYVNWPPRRTAVKLASSEITNRELLVRLANCTPWMTTDGMPHPPVLLSLGEVVHQNQVHTAIARLVEYDLTLMACVAEYPVKRPLDLLSSLIFAQTFGLPVGVSSHVAADRAAWAAGQAVKKGAVVVEVHLRAVWTPKDAPDNGAWALYSDELAELVEAVRNTG